MLSPALLFLIIGSPAAPLAPTLLEAEPAPSQRGGLDWTALQLPPLCAPQPAPLRPIALIDGVHVLLRPRGGDLEPEAPPPKLPTSLVQQMLEADAVLRGGRIEFLRAAPTLVARGDENVLRGARALLADLNAQGELLEIELSCELTGTARGVSPLISGRTRVRSGEEAFFGTRLTQSFLSGYDVEVAADSGVARPIRGSVLHGATVHVDAARIDGGKRVHLEGLLDIAVPGETVRFDPDTPDLGILEQPTVASVQIAFAGVVDSGGRLEVSLQGAPLATRDLKLVLVATARPDPEPAAQEGGWALLDLAFLASEPRAHRALTPGGRLSAEAGFAGHVAPPVALAPAALAATLEESRSNASPGARAPLFWTSDLLLVPRADANLLRDTRALVRASEAARQNTGRVELRQGAFSVSLPVCDGCLARVWAGTERPYLTEYRSELAPQSWMPVPDVELVSDGVCAELQPFSGTISCHVWATASQPPTEIARLDAQLGKLQMLRRSLWSDSARIARKEAPRALLANAGANGDGSAALTIAFDVP